MTTADAPPTPTSLPRATLPETLGVVGGVLAPTVAKGVILRRPTMVALAERMAADHHAVRRLQRLRDRHGAGPVLLRVAGRPLALLLAPDQVRRVLAGTPEPFAAATREKRAALQHFQPNGVLIARGAVRDDRRRYNDAVLDSGCPRHRMAARFAAVAREEGGPLRDAARAGALAWSPYVAAWFRMVRRVVLGDAARDDVALTHLLARLRADANWAFLHPKRRALRARFGARLEAHLARAEPGSLAHVMAGTPAAVETDPPGQVPQWLFAFDAAAIATFRALALLAVHPAHAARAREEACTADGDAPTLPFLRACVLESVRLWPTTPMVLRQTTAPTAWEAGAMPAGTGVVIFAPFFHRDDTRLPFADRFAPELWLDGPPPESLALVPFSDGPAACPGRQLVLLLASTLLATLLADGTPRLASATPLDPARPLPRTLDNFTLRFGRA